MYIPDEWMKAMSKLSGDDFKALTMAMHDVVSKGHTDADLGTAPEMLLDMVMPYLRKQHDDRENGKRGGRPKKKTASDDEETGVSEIEKGGFETEKGGFSENEKGNSENEKPYKYKYKYKININTSKEGNMPAPDTIREFFSENGGTDMAAQKFRLWLMDHRCSDWRARAKIWITEDKARGRPATRFHNLDERHDDLDEYALQKMRKELGLCDT